MTDTTLLYLYRRTDEFLKKRSGQGFAASRIDRLETKRINNIKTVYQCLLDALLFTKKMREAIGQVEAMDKALFEFDPIKTAMHYDDKPDKLIKQMNREPDSKDGNKQKEYLNVFCEGALSAAFFLTHFKDVEAFRVFVKGFQYNEMTMAVLPLLLQKEIVELGFQGACLFLSNTGYSEYVAPEPKVKTLFMDIGVTESTGNYEASKTLFEMSLVSCKHVAVLHKGFWLIANGKIKEDGDKDPELRQEYLDYIIKKLFKQSPT